MSLLSLVLPIAGVADATEDVKVTTALTAIQTWANGNIDGTNMGAPLTSAFTVYTPTFAATGGGAVGNGVLVGRYWRIGKMCGVTIYFAVGTTTNQGSGPWTFALPFAAVSDSANQTLSGFVGPAGLFYPVAAVISPGSASTGSIWANGTVVESGQPGVWVSGNVLALSGIYETV